MTMTEQIAADLNLVITHVLTDADGLYHMPAVGHFVVRVAEASFTNPNELGIVVGWVLHRMCWTARHRSLTNDEVLIYSAALRVSEIRCMFDTLAVLGQAIEAKDWDEARRQWLLLAPWHGSLIGAWPDAEYLNILLQDLTQTAIH